MYSLNTKRIKLKKELFTSSTLWSVQDGDTVSINKIIAVCLTSLNQQDAFTLIKLFGEKRVLSVLSKLKKSTPARDYQEAMDQIFYVLHPEEYRSRVPKICLLDNDDQVAFWYRNGDRGREFFPDFIVKYTDGTVGIYDTESEMTAADGEAKEKGEFLYKYCEKFDLKGRLLTLVPVSGNIKKFLINDREYYTNYDPNNLQWTEFSKPMNFKSKCDKLN